MHKNKLLSSWNEMARQRIPIVPSIPYNATSRGYEVSEDGSLVQQVIKDSESVGPGYYDLPNAFSIKQGGNWHISKTQRLLLDKDKNNSLGPGSYEINLKTNNVSNKYGTSSFMPSVSKAIIQEENDENKENEKEANITPGPGQYNTNISSYQKKATSSSIQGFGSIASRFNKKEDTNNPNIGPGKYGDFRQNYVLSL